MNDYRESDITAYAAERSFHATRTHDLQDFLFGSFGIAQFDTECLTNKTASEERKAVHDPRYLEQKYSSRLMSTMQ